MKTQKIYFSLIHLAVIVITIVGFCSYDVKSALSEAGSNNLENYFPIEEGTIKKFIITYKEDNKILGKMFAKYVTLKKVNIKGDEIIPLTFEMKNIYGIIRQSMVFYYHITEKFQKGIGVKKAGDQEMEKMSFIILQAPIKVGSTWKSKIEELDVLSRIERIDETIKVPAGVFKNCIKVVNETPESKSILWIPPDRLGAVKTIDKVGNMEEIWQLNSFSKGIK
jgi:hypothetical protein